jgi:hypothetical protein
MTEKATAGRRYARLSISTGSLVASVVVSAAIAAVWVALRASGESIPNMFAFGAGSVYAWLLLEVLMRTKYRHQVEQ